MPRDSIIAIHRFHSALAVVTLAAVITANSTLASPFGPDRDPRHFGDGYREGYQAAYQSAGRGTAPSPPTPSPNPRRSGDNRSDFERGYSEGLTKALERLNRRPR
ncbi:MAG: hypothetical protein K9L32_02315 [Chromatiaceae bacterium]|nr:hypothetical protein [Chromatiaceae bacterium]